MRQFPRTVQVYIWAVIGLGLLALAFGWRLGIPAGHEAWLAIGCAAAALASFGKVPLLGLRTKPGTPGQSTSTISLGFVPTFFLLLLLGPFAGMLAGMLNALITTCHPRRSYYYQVLFSMAGVCIASLCAGLVAHPFGLAPASLLEKQPDVLYNSPQALRVIPVVAAATIVYYLTNVGLVAGVVSLLTGRRLRAVWAEDFLWLAPSYFVAASCAVMVLCLWPYVATYPWASLGLVGAALPLPVFMFFAFRAHRTHAIAREQHISDLRAGKAELEQANVELERTNQELERSQADLHRLFTSMMESMARAIDAKDRYTKDHVQRVRGLAVSIAHELGIFGEEMQAVETGALLHDIGKLAVPEYILTKPGKLTPEEFDKIKAHPETGERILQPVPFPFPVLPIVRSHHERWDGSGYPDGLRAEAIPLGARILAVADVYDALTTDRSYRRGWTPEEAVRYLDENAGKHFDPAVVHAFHAAVARDLSLLPVSDAGSDGSRNGTDRAVAQINRAALEYIAQYEIAQVVSTTQDLPQTLSLISGKALNIFKAASCVVLLRGDNGDLAAHCAVGAHESLFTGSRARATGGPTLRAVETGRGFLGSFDTSDLRLRQENGESGRTLPRSCLIAPLIADGQTLGTVNLYHERTEAFNEEDLQVLQTISISVARAIRNAQDYDQTRVSAYTDALTGLFNARHLAQYLDREIARARAEVLPLTVLLLDLDNFKPINDTFGHARGNDVLRDLGGAFEAVLRHGDLVARYAGDEFVIALPGTGCAEARLVIDKLRAAVDGYDPRVSGGDLGTIRVGVSIGVASFPQDGQDAATLIGAADRNMYRDKSERKRGGQANQRGAQSAAVVHAA